MADKQLKIGSSFDSKGFADMENALKRVTKLAQEFTDQLKKATFGKNDNKNHPDNFSNSVGQASQAIDKLNKALQDTDKTMIHGTQKSLTHTSRHFREYTNNVNEAASATGRLHAAMGAAMGQGANASGSQFGAAAGFGGGGRGGVYGGLPGGGSQQAITAGGGGGNGGPPGSPSWWSRFNSNPGGQAIGNTAMNWGAGAVGALNLGSTLYAGDAAVERQELFGGMEAAIRAQRGRDTLFRMVQGNANGYGNILAQKGMAFHDGKGGGKDPYGPGATFDAANGGGFADEVNQRSTSIVEKNLEAQRLGSFAKIGGGLLQAAGSVAAGVVAAPFSGGLSMPAGIAGAGHAASGTANSIIEKKLDEMKISQGERAAQKGEMEAHYYQLLEGLGGAPLAAASAAQQGTAGVRVAASRAMGGGKFSGQMFGQGASRGFDMGEATALGAGMSGQFGWNHSRSLVPRAMDLGNQGIDASVAGQVMGRVHEGGGNDKEVFRKLFAEGVSQGMKQLDGSFFQRIGMAVAEASVTSYGGNASIASGSALMSGLGPNPSMREVQGNISGMALANNQQQTNNFFASRNLVDASTIMGGNATGEEMEVLGGASFEDLMSQASKGNNKGEGGNELMNTFGVTKEQAQTALDKRINRTGSLLTNGESPPAKRLKAAVAKYGGFKEALQSGDKAVVADAAALGFTRLGGADLDSFKGEMRAFGGMSASDMANYENRKGADGNSVTDKGALGEKNKQIGQVLQNVTHYTELYAEAQKKALGVLASSLETAKKLSSVEGLGSVEATNEAFKKMGEAAPMAANVLEELAKRVSVAWGIDVTKLNHKSNKTNTESKNEAAQKDPGTHNNVKTGQRR